MLIFIQDLSNTNKMKQSYLDTGSLFVWPWLVVNDRKFLAGTVFFFHTNQPAVLLHEPATIRTSQPNRLTIYAHCAVTAMTLPNKPAEAGIVYFMYEAEVIAIDGHTAHGPT